MGAHCNLSCSIQWCHVYKCWNAHLNWSHWFGRLDACNSTSISSTSRHESQAHSIYSYMTLRNVNVLVVRRNTSRERFILAAGLENHIGVLWKWGWRLETEPRGNYFRWWCWCKGNGLEVKLQRGMWEWDGAVWAQEELDVRVNWRRGRQTEIKGQKNRHVLWGRGGEQRNGRSNCMLMCLCVHTVCVLVWRWQPAKKEGRPQMRVWVV